jgi:hypothetical protein
VRHCFAFSGIGSVFGLFVLLGVEAGGRRNLHLDAELPLALAIDRKDYRFVGGADDHQEGSGDDCHRDALVSYQHGGRS